MIYADLQGVIHALLIMGGDFLYHPLISSHTHTQTGLSAKSVNSINHHDN